MKKLQILLAITLFAFSSCATILSGNKDAVNLKNVPESATIKVNGIPQKRSSIKIMENNDRVKIRKSNIRTSKISVTNEGCKDVEYGLERQMMFHFVALDLLCGVVPLVIDLADQNIYTAKPNRINYICEPTSNEPIDTDE